MIVVPPISIITNLSRIISSNLTDGTQGDPAIWSGATAYVVGDRARVVSTNTIYEALVAITGGSEPNINTTSWIDVSYVNRLNMFDITSNTTSKSSGNIVVQVNPVDRVDNIAFMGLVNVTNINLRITDQYDVDVYPATNLPVTGTFINVSNITSMSNSKVYITISGTGTIQIAEVVFGKKQDIGTLQSGVQLNTLNFSTIERAFDGTAYMIKRANVPKINCNTLVLASEVARMLYVRDLVNASPALWVGDTVISEFVEPFVLFGIYRTFSIQTDNVLSATINLELEGL